MEKEFIPYEQALELAKLNFNEKCFGYYGIENKLHFEISSNLDSNLTRRNFLSAPLFSQAFRWFREKYGLYHNINKHGYWFFEIKKDEGFGDLTEVSIVFDFKSYEESELDCLEKLIEIVEQKNKKDETN